MLSVSKKVHHLVLSVFFLRFFFQPHARPWVKRETNKKKSALRSAAVPTWIAYQGVRGETLTPLTVRVWALSDSRINVKSGFVNA